MYQINAGRAAGGRRRSAGRVAIALGAGHEQSDGVRSGPISGAGRARREGRPHAARGRVLQSNLSLLCPILSIRDLDFKGKRVFIRVDFNVPLQKNDQGEMEITSDKRIKASLPTIQYALEHGAGVILASHLGRPKGKPNPEMSLKPVAARLAGIARKAGEDGAGLRRAGSRGDEAGARRGAAAREPALPCRGREERSGVRASSWPRCATFT